MKSETIESVEELITAIKSSRTVYIPAQFNGRDVIIRISQEEALDVIDSVDNLNDKFTGVMAVKHYYDEPIQGKTHYLILSE